MIFVDWTVAVSLPDRRDGQRWCRVACVGLRGSGDRRTGVFFAAEFVACGVFKLALIKGNSGFSTSWAQMKEHEISKERAITDSHTPPGS